MADGVVLITHIGEVGGASVAAETIARVSFFGEITGSFQLEDGRAQAVKDRPSAIDLDTEGLLRSVGDENIRAGVNRAVREVDGEIRHLVDMAAVRRGEQFFAAKLVAVEADHDPIRHAARFFDLL